MREGWRQRERGRGRGGGGRGAILLATALAREVIRYDTYIYIQTRRRVGWSLPRGFGRAGGKKKMQTSILTD